jgi:hypothetical protein
MAASMEYDHLQVFCGVELEVLLVSEMLMLRTTGGNNVLDA